MQDKNIECKDITVMLNGQELSGFLGIDFPVGKDRAGELVYGNGEAHVVRNSGDFPMSEELMLATDKISQIIDEHWHRINKRIEDILYYVLKEKYGIAKENIDDHDLTYDSTHNHIEYFYRKESLLAYDIKNSELRPETDAMTARVRYKFRCPVDLPPELLEEI